MFHGLLRYGLVLTVLVAAGAARAADWPEWRGPARDGVSTETGLPETWSPTGENLLWRAPYGTRSAPIVIGGRVFVHAPLGTGAATQERIACLDATTGRPVWEVRFPVFHTDVPAHRVAWSSPAADPLTGNIYSLGVDGELRALSRDGKVLWTRSLTEEYGAITTHGGRTVAPIVEDDLVIVSTLTAGWGDQARGGNRYFAFDKATGEGVWVAAPQARHYDTNYSNPVVATVDGMKILVVGGTDGALHALKVATGEPVWKYESSKRSINTAPVVRDGLAFFTHSEENYDSNTMGQVAAIDLRSRGEVKPENLRWRTDGSQGGYSSPVADAERLYVVDNGAVLLAFDLKTGRRLWDKHLGTIQKASLALGDGKLYVGTENGTFYILRPRADGVDVLDQDHLGTEAQPEIIIGSVAIADGRVFLPSMDALYAIGGKARPARRAARPSAPAAVDTPGEPAFVQVRPAEVLLQPGETARFRARLYDARGRFVREEAAAAWATERLAGEVVGGAYRPPAGPPGQAGLVKATVGALIGTARVRVLPPAPWTEGFDGMGEAPPPYWINSTGKFVVRPRAEGGKALAKLADNPFTKRGRLFVGPFARADYTVEADVLATEKRRQMGDAGVIAQRYVLTLFGNSQRLDLQPWQANAARTVSKPFAWKPETWYRLKLRVENLSGGRTLVQGKAWAASGAEPAEWTIELRDDLPHREGAPGLYADAPHEVFFDNVEVTPNGGQR
jgi:outer membrane protein assembly factor BamB